jgi:hypothetical protein
VNQEIKRGSGRSRLQTLSEVAAPASSRALVKMDAKSGSKILPSINSGGNYSLLVDVDYFQEHRSKRTLIIHKWNVRETQWPQTESLVMI